MRGGHTAELHQLQQGKYLCMVQGQGVLPGRRLRPSDKIKAMERAMEFGDRIPIGILYREERPDYHEMNRILAGGNPS